MLNVLYKEKKKVCEDFGIENDGSELIQILSSPSSSKRFDYNGSDHKIKKNNCCSIF